MTTTVDSLYRGFRHSYLDYEALTAQLRAWAEAFPDIVRLQSLAQTREGRDLWLLTIGPEPDRRRPAVWIDGNMHAGEAAGSSVALAVAEAMIRLHIDPGATPPALDLPAALAGNLRDVLFFVMPRMSPDGAERVLKTGRFLRSVPHDDPLPRERPYWRPGDVDGDGLALRMRKLDPAGEYVESKVFPGCMMQRELEDEGPFYKLFPEGFIENFDGETIPTPHYLDDNPTDLNRNFPFNWTPPHEQEGAGHYPLNEAESRAVVAFTSATPTLFAWLNLHTFGGVFIRPLGHKPDTDMDPVGPRGLQADRGLGRPLHGIPDRQRLRGVHLPAQPAHLRRPHRLRLSPARLHRLRLRAVGPLRPGRAEEAEALRRPLHETRSRGRREDLPLGP